MGTNVATILAHIYMAKLELLLKEKCKTDIKLKWHTLFKRFIDDGFGIMKGNKLDFEFWIAEFNLWRETITNDKFKYGKNVEFMDLYIYMAIFFYESEKVEHICFPKEEV